MCWIPLNDPEEPGAHTAYGLGRSLRAAMNVTAAKYQNQWYCQAPFGPRPHETWREGCRRWGR